jgi:hypothetical protein
VRWTADLLSPVPSLGTGNRAEGFRFVETIEPQEMLAPELSDSSSSPRGDGVLATELGRAGPPDAAHRFSRLWLGWALRIDNESLG